MRARYLDSQFAMRDEDDLAGNPSIHARFATAGLRLHNDIAPLQYWQDCTWALDRNRGRTGGRRTGEPGTSGEPGNRGFGEPGSSVNRGKK